MSAAGRAGCARRPEDGRWQATTSAVGRVAAGTALVLLGLLAGRPDVAVIGVPLVLSIVWALSRRPRGVTHATIEAPRYVPQRSRIEADLVLDPPAGVHTTRLRVGSRGHRDREVLLDGRTGRTLQLSLETARTGRQRVFAVGLLDRAVGSVLRADPTTIEPVSLLAVPEPEPLGALPLPFRLQGLTGAHRSVRPGDGGELRDIAVFASGDRMRRIDWKATARRGTSAPTAGGGGMNLYVRRTFATADATVMLVVDSRDAVGPDITTWGSGDIHPADPTSLDIARRAAISLARRYLDQGDRVGLVDLGRHRRPLVPAGGRRHLARITHHVGIVEPEGEPTAHRRAPLVPSGALVVVFSTFLDEEAAHLAQTWRHGGHRTLAVDVLPTSLPDGLTPRDLTAYRIVRMERRDRLEDLAASGVEVVTWEGDDTADVQVSLAALSRVRRVGR